MELDIKEKILNDFGNEAFEAINLLEMADSKLKLGPRVSRCIVVLASGSISKLKKAINEAEIDWRDVILSAETKDFEFNKPFKTNKPH